MITIGAGEGGTLPVDLDILLRTRLLVQANSGAGKSWLLRRLAEQLFGRVQVIIIDPEGEFSTLRGKFGYVLCGSGGETPAHPRSASLLARRLLELNASAVCDIFELRPAERHRWVRLFLESLIDAPKALWRPLVVVVDEAHIFCPEKGAGESEASGPMIDLASRGRKCGYCAIFATQRLGKLRKDAAAELTNVLVGRAWMDVDRDRAADILGVSRSERAAFDAGIRSLRPGQFWALGPALATARTLVQVGAVATTHPEAGSAKHSAAPPPTPAAVQKLLPKLSDLPQEAEQKAKTEADLMSEIRSLKARLAQQPKAEPDGAVISRAVDSALAAARAEHARAIAAHQRESRELRTVIFNAALALQKPVSEVEGGPVPVPAPAQKTAQIIPQNIPSPLRGSTRGAQPRVAAAGGSMGKGERAVLKAIAMYADGAERDQLSVLTGYKRSSRDAYIQRLSSAGYVEVSGARLTATESGIAALGSDNEPLPTGVELQRYWLERLGGGEREILALAIQFGGQPFRREEIDAALPYKRSSRDAYLQRLTSRRLIEPCGSGQIRAAAVLF